jgi:hypothetical protein
VDQQKKDQLPWKSRVWKDEGHRQTVSKEEAVPGGGPTWENHVI